MHHSPAARLSAVAATVLLSCGLAACTTDGDGGEGDGTATETTATTTTETTAVSETSSAEETPATSSAESAEETSSAAASSSRNGMPRDVNDAYELFGSLAPISLFREFDSCNPSGIDKAYECSGREIGQFQFFDSMAKAASTTQLLTELRSSRVVEDTGSRVVGWSTLGTTAVITVVDNDKGLVMQQMVSSDQVDPEQKITELGLVSESAESAESSEAAEPTEPTGADGN
ncbi:hypothetical protein [Corynebacterium suedekumii]|uniref:Beta-N-acetylglucosaminidase n=1 Tax=Corynebacterium suedekumii TaxID=3049801 RepID=A0ABY8VJ43_9CORY|nr:hypothetical protein [Corynebacterium suedekumii]WIM69097.1 hypothetical protein QP029_07240 [Corynebacterium suedekumii]